MGSRFKSAVRSLLDHLGEGLMWMGLAWSGMYPPFRMNPTATADPDQRSMPPLSEEELAAWATLEERLR